MATLSDFEKDQRDRIEQLDVTDRLQPVVITIEEPGVQRRDQAEQIQRFMLNKARQTELEIDMIKDTDWVGSSPYEIGYDLTARHEMVRFRSTADRRFEDTSLGGNYVCNPRPGFTPYADVPRKGLLTDRNPLTPTAMANNLGMGHVYSTMIDNNYHVIDLRFGKPEYNSIFGFSTTAYSAKDALLANTGSYSGFFYLLGQAGGIAVGFALLGPLLATGTLMVSYAAGALNNIIATNPHKFWYVRPQMTMYWRAVHNMVNQILSFKTMVTGAGQINAATGQPEDGLRGDENVIGQLNKIAPSIFSPDGTVNVRQVVNRAERLNQHIKTAYNKKIESASDYDELVRGVDEILAGFSSASVPPDREDNLMVTYLELNGLQTENKDDVRKSINKLLMGDMESRYGDSSTVFAEGGTPTLSKQGLIDAKKSAEEGDRYAPGLNDTAESGFLGKLNKFWEYWKMELSDGSAFASFRVDHMGPVSESFSNSTMKNDLATKFNEISASGRAAYFTFAGGNILPGADEIMGGLKSLAAGTLDILKLDGLMALAGSSYIDVPEMWENGSFDPPSTNYQFRLVSPSAHPLEQLHFIYIPLAMIICGAVPHAAGKASYTHPFFCELYDRGRGIVRNGLITQLLINRGVSNLGFTQSKDMLAVDVQFTVKNLSSANYMPIEAGITVDPAKTINALDTTYSDYIATLGAATLGQNVYKGQKLKIRLRNYQSQIKDLTTMDHWAAFFRELPGISNLDVFFPDSGRGG